MTSMLDRVDPESRPALEVVRSTPRPGLTTLDDIVARRERSDRLNAEAVAAAGGPDPSVRREDRLTPGLDDDPDVPVRIYRPADADPGARLPGILFIHSGGMLLGSLDGEDRTAAQYAREVGAVVVSSGYRKAPEHPHPAQSRDCFAALRWMVDHAAELGFDPERLVVVGGSAGGNLALATALRARDEHGPALRLVLAAYPMLDPSNTTASSHAIADLGLWDRADNLAAWSWWLGGQEPDTYASPLLEDDWSGVAPVFLDVGTLDLFRDEDIALATALAAQGHPVEFHLYPGAYHGSEELAPEASLSRRIVAARLDALRRAVAT